MTHSFVELVRMTVSQPSHQQQHHKLDGRKVLAYRESVVTVRVFFTEGPVVSMQMSPLCLIRGWAEDRQHLLPTWQEPLLKAEVRDKVERRKKFESMDAFFLGEQDGE